MKRRTSVLLGCTSWIGLALTATPTIAQETQADTSGQIEEIVVTAQFREQNLQDTPIAITAVNAAMLEARGQVTIDQVAAQAPNVTLAPQGQQNGAGMVAFIRGVGQIDFNYALEPGVGIYVDDVYIPSLSASMLELLDLDRVEILRGPQGTLSGRNAIGGAIKLFSAKPQGDGSGSIQATYGSYDRVDMRGMMDFAVSENVAARVSAVSRNQDGFVKRLDYGLTHPGSGVLTNGQGPNPQLGTLGGISYAAARLAVRWNPSAKVEVNIIGDYTRDRSESSPSVLVFGNHPGANANGMPWLPSTIDGSVIPLDCRFVPHGVNSCDTLTGYDTRYVSYASFMDQTPATSQAPYKPFHLDPHQYLTDYGINGSIDVDLAPNLQLKSITAWREFVSDWAQDVDNTPLTSQMLNQHLVNTQWSEELRLNGQLMDGALDFTVGGYYFDRNGTLTARVDLNYAGIDFIHGPDTTPATNKAAFANVTYHANADLNVTAGVRYSEDHKEYTFFRRNPDLTVPNAPCAFFLGAPTAGPTGIGNDPNCLLFGLNGEVAPKVSNNRTDWRVAVDYRISESLMGYAQVATGYRAGGINPRPFFGSSAGPLNQIKSFDPETLTTYEVGFKADLLDNRLRLNSAFFFNDYKDIIVTLAQCPIAPCLQPNNVGTADVKGVEVEVTFRPTEALSIDASIAYLDFQYKKLNATSAELGGLTLDMITPFTPETTFSGGIQYDWDDVAGGTLSARVDGYYQSHIYTEPINIDDSPRAPRPGANAALGVVHATNRIDSRFLANAHLTWTAPEEDWRVIFEVQNLTDKYYFTSMYEQSGGPTSGANTISGAPGLPRTWSMTFKHDF